MKLGFYGAMTSDYKQTARPLPGLGLLPLINEFCVRLKGIDYDGPCSIELCRPEYLELGSHTIGGQSMGCGHQRSVTLL